jgi:hypothetical protein
MMFFTGQVIAQKDSIPADTSHTDFHSPNKALLLSAVLPGAGQFYNKKYWKIPVLYAGFAACGYFIKFNDIRYQKYRKAYIQRVDGDSLTIDPYVNLYTDANLLDLKNYYRRNRDLTIIITVAVYVINLLDAYVDAHLFNFNVNDNLSLRVAPDLQMNEQYKSYAGLQVRLNFH